MLFAHVHTLFRISSGSVCTGIRVSRNKFNYSSGRPWRQERKWEADQGNVSKRDEERGKGKRRARCPGLKRNRRKPGWTVATPCWYGKIKACR